MQWGVKLDSLTGLKNCERDFNWTKYFSKDYDDHRNKIRLDQVSQIKLILIYHINWNQIKAYHRLIDLQEHVLRVFEPQDLQILSVVREVEAHHSQQSNIKNFSKFETC